MPRNCGTKFVHVQLGEEPGANSSKSAKSKHPVDSPSLVAISLSDQCEEDAPISKIRAGAREKEAWDHIRNVVFTKAPGLAATYLATRRISLARTSRQCALGEKVIPANPNDEHDQAARAVLILASTWGQISNRNTDAVSRQLGAIFKINGAPARVIKVAHRLGICASNEVIDKALRELQKRPLRHDPNKTLILAAHDNCQIGKLPDKNNPDTLTRQFDYQLLHIAKVDITAYEHLHADTYAGLYADGTPVPEPKKKTEVKIKDLLPADADIERIQSRCAPR